VTIREEGAEDAANVRALITTAFGDRLVADLDTALARRAGGAAYVASAPQGTVGHVRLTWGWVDAPARLVEVLVLSPLSVAPVWQGRGIGRELVRRAVTGATELGSPLLFLEGDPAYYSRSGFEPALPYGFMRPSVRIPEPAFQVIRLPGYEPWMTGALVYPDTFWTFDCVGLRTDAPG
jgi:putative acetyltransferase